jgi:hypothetical protein
VGWIATRFRPQGNPEAVPGNEQETSLCEAAESQSLSTSSLSILTPKGRTP